jgi:hypothetical protein
MGYAYSNNGLSCRAWDDSATIASGEVYFDHEPTTTELTAAFPAASSAVAGSRPYTLTTNFVSGDTDAFESINFTATSATQDATNFIVGSDITASMANLATALNANSTVSAKYTATASEGVITVTEITAGDGNTPGSMVITGTGVISSGTATTSAAAVTEIGYVAAVKAAKIDVLDAEYESQFSAITQAYLTALAASDTTTAEARQADYATFKTAYTTALEAIS